MDKIASIYNNIYASYCVIHDKLFDKKSQSSDRYFENVSHYNQCIMFFSPPTHIIDNIYLGSAFNAANYKLLKELDINVIINVTNEISNYYPKDFDYFCFPIDDSDKPLDYLNSCNLFKNLLSDFGASAQDKSLSDKEDLISSIGKTFKSELKDTKNQDNKLSNIIRGYLRENKMYEQTFQKIESNKNKKILVHCFMGASRSVSIIINYLIKKYKYTLSDAINFIKQKRPFINPNNKFIRDFS